MSYFSILLYICHVQFSLDRENQGPGVDRTVIEDVMKHRTKEFSARQLEAALKAK